MRTGTTNTANAAMRTSMKNTIITSMNAAVSTARVTITITKTLAAADIITGIRTGTPAAAGTSTAGMKTAKSASC